MTIPKRNWVEADVYCRSIDSKLVSIETKEESDWITNQLITHGKIKCYPFFFGLNEDTNFPHSRLPSLLVGTIFLDFGL